MGRHHMEPLYTRIADRDVLVEQGLRTSVYFSEGCKPEDAEGFYEFWTLENKEGEGSDRPFACWRGPWQAVSGYGE